MTTQPEMSLDEALRARLGPLRRRVDDALASRATGWAPLPPLTDAMAYAVLGDGKRMRPCMTLAACTAAGGDDEHAMAAAIALELVHAYSLVHDDLPAMDDDDERRGRPTVHVRWDEATGILAGDALLTDAFAVLAEGGAPDRRLRCVAELARAAGYAGMVGGQVLDIAAPQPEIGALRQMHALKTGQLFVAACRMGAILAGADDRVVERLATFGGLVGEAFQVSDDMLDSLEIGQTGGAHEADVNVVTLLGLAGAADRVEQVVARALDQLDELPGDAETLRMLVTWIGERARDTPGRAS